MKSIPAKLLRLLGALFLTFMFCTGCQTNVGPTNPFDPETPADKQAAARLSGVVLSELSQAPVQNAEVKLEGPTVPGDNPIYSGIDGTFSFPELLPGSYLLVVTHPNHEDRSLLIVLGAGEVAEDIEIVLAERSSTSENTGRLTGLVRKGAELVLVEEEQDHSGIVVEASGLGIRTVTNHLGQFDLYLAAGTYTILLSAPEHNPTSRSEVVVEVGQVNQLSEDPVVLPANPGSLAGRVLVEGAEAQGHGGVLVDLSGGVQTTTSNDGSFLIGEVPPGSYQVTFSLDGYENQVISNITIRGGRQVELGDIELAISRTSLSGLVQLAGQQNHWGVVVALDNTNHVSVSSANGDFLLERVPVGTYTLTARRDGFRTAVVADILLEANTPVDLGQLTLNPLNGSIELAQGANFSSQRTVSADLVGEGATHMRLTGDLTTPDLDFRPFLPQVDLDLSEGSGPKTVHFQFRDNYGVLSNTFSASIILDGTAPTVHRVQVDDDSGYVTSPDGAAVLIVDCSDNLFSSEQLELMVEDDNQAVIYQGPYQGLLDVDLGTNEGDRNLAVRCSDPAGNLSQPIGRDLVLDHTPPQVNQFELNGGTANERTADHSVLVHLEVIDLISGNARVALLENAIDCQTVSTDLDPDNTPDVAFQLSAGDGLRSVYLCARDAAGNVTPVAVASQNAIELDTLGPAIPDLFRTEISDQQISLAWTRPTDAFLAGYVLQRRLQDEGSFKTIAPDTPGDLIPSDTLTFSNQIDAALNPMVLGKRHYYRLWAEDDLGNRSGLSIELDAGVPFSPVRMSANISANERLISWDQPTGTTLMLSTYRYFDDALGRSVEEPLALNQQVLDLSEIDTGTRMNEYLIVRSSNNDNSLVWEAEYGIGNQRKYLAHDGMPGWSLATAMDAQGVLHISYSDRNLFNLQYMKLDSDCLADLDNCPIELDPDYGVSSDIAIDSQGIAHIVYPQSTTNIRYIKVDGVNTIQTISVGSAAAIAIDSLDVPYMVTSQAGDLYLERLDGSGPILLDQPSNVTNDLALALDSVDTPHVLYYDRTSGFAKYIKANADCFADLVNCPVSIDEIGAWNASLAMVLDQNGTPHIAFKDFTGFQGPAYMYLNQTCLDDLANCPLQLAAGSNVGDYPDIVIGPMGNAHIAYLNKATETCDYVQVDPVAGPGAPRAVAPIYLPNGLTSRPGVEVSHLDGVVHVCNFEGSAGAMQHIKLVGEVRPKANSWDSGSLGTGLSAATDRQGIAHLAYYDWSVNSVIYLKADGQSTRQVVEGTGFNSSMLSGVAIDSTDVVHLVYDSSTAGGVRYYKMDGVDTPSTLMDGTRNPTLIVDSSDTAHATYYHQANQELYYQKLDGVSAPVLIDSCDWAFCAAYLAEDPSSQEIITAYFNPNQGGGYLRLLKLDGQSSPDSVREGSVITGIDLVIDSQGIAHLVYREYVDHSYQAFYQSMDGQSERMRLGSIEVSNAAVAIDADDSLHFIYKLTLNGDLVYWRMDGVSTPLMVLDGDTESVSMMVLNITPLGVPQIALTNSSIWGVGTLEWKFSQMLSKTSLVQK
jgi:hypothetical protein